MGALMVSGALVAVFALVWPRYDAIQEAKDNLAAKELAIAKKQKFVEKMTDLRKQIEARRDDLSKLENLLSSGKHAEEITVNIEAITQEAGVTIGEFRSGAGKSESGENFEILPIELTVSGPYAAIFNLVKLLERNLRIFDIQEVSINKKEGGVFTAPLLASLKMNTYYLKR